MNQRFRPKVRWLVPAAALLAAATVIAPAPTAKADPPVQDSKLMLVLDSSGSMKERLPGGDRRIDAAKQALKTVINELPDDQAVGLRVFGAKVFDRRDKGACTDSQQVVGLGTDNRAQLEAALAKYKPYGETPIGYALSEAGKDVGTDGQRTIVLVSDGEPTCRPDPCEVASRLAEQGIKLRIEVVGFDVSGKAETALRCIADQGNGSYYDADDAGDLAQALGAISTRAMKPYRAIGQPITGTETAEGAPLLTPGDWKDRIGGVGSARSELFYTFRRTMPGATLHLSASLTTLDDQDGLEVRVLGDQADCGFASEGHGVEYGQVISASITAPGSIGDWNEDCTDNDEYTIVIKRDERRGADNAVPLEIRVMEERPVESVDALPAELPEPEYSEPDLTSPKRIVGGSSFGAAPEIEPGAYRGTIVPGEVQIFAVPVDWGQHLIATAQIPPLSSRISDEIGTNWLNVKLFSPSRGVAENVFESETQTIVKDAGTEGHATSFAVAYRHRDKFTAAGSVNRAGLYYVAVGMAPDDGKAYELPFTLGVSVEGEIKGRPTYRTAASAPPSASPTASPSTSTPATTSTAPASTAPASTAPKAPPTAGAERNEADPSPLLAVVGWTLGGLGVLAVTGGIVTAVILLRRRS